MHHSLQFIWILMLITTAGLGGCDDNTGTSAVPNQPTASAQQLDLEATMKAYAKTLETEAAILRIELDPNQQAGEVEAQQLWAVLQQRLRRADEIEAMLKENPTWAQSVCQWYNAQLREPAVEVARLQNQISSRDGDTPQPNGFARLLKQGAGSADAAREYLKTMSDHPGEPTNLHIMCVKFGSVDDA